MLLSLALIFKFLSLKINTFCFIIFGLTNNFFKIHILKILFLLQRVDKQ